MIMFLKFLIMLELLWGKRGARYRYLGRHHLGPGREHAGDLVRHVRWCDHFGVARAETA